MDGTRWERNRLLTLAAAGLLLAVLGYWALQLWGGTGALPAPRVQVATRPAAPDSALATPLVRLQSPGAVQTEVRVLGVLAGTHAPLALLSINGAPADPYVPGQRLGSSTVLETIDAGGVQLRQAGQLRTLAAPALPAVPDDGIVPASATH
ncbi:MAG: hypothetical protein GAK31_00169 [Stenotrophomonas maltophilia]|uniref:General secretion pathway protein n=1 Tax=Stenotrophomonas maltophilia TaxID=40324 RepID=A0A7V8FIT1_STEMA|nr:MAG: hypothetical protein GAK31_00169 [Stenotrophomonas maltophilia]